MNFVPSTQRQRSKTFETIQGYTTERLQLPGIRADLGERATALGELVAAMYLVNLRHGEI